MKIVISEIGGKLLLKEEHAKQLCEWVSDDLKDKIQKIKTSQNITLLEKLFNKKNNKAQTVSEFVDILFGTLANKMRCNKWLVRIVEENHKSYPHLFINDVPTSRFVIEYDRNGKEEFRSDENYDWENVEDWKEE